MPYCIREDYAPRLENAAFDDTPNTDLWQNDVYRLAKKVAMKEGLKTVLDVGCGSGYKLLKYFKRFPTVGSEVEPTLSWLKERYPDRAWLPLDGLALKYDLVISADVIEHVPDPDALLEMIKRVHPKRVVISTPDRSMLVCDQQGPPRNICHIREWSFDEFGMYLSEHFNVIRHYICNEEQCTQVAVLEPKP